VCYFETIYLRTTLVRSVVYAFETWYFIHIPFSHSQNIKIWCWKTRLYTYYKIGTLNCIPKILHIAAIILIKIIVRLFSINRIISNIVGKNSFLAFKLIGLFPNVYVNFSSSKGVYKLILVIDITTSYDYHTIDISTHWLINHDWAYKCMFADGLKFKWDGDNECGCVAH